MSTSKTVLLSSICLTAGCATGPELPWYDKSVHKLIPDSLTRVEDVASLHGYISRLRELEYVPPKKECEVETVDLECLIENVVIFATKSASPGVYVSSAEIHDVFDMQQTTSGVAADSEQVTNVQERGVDEGDIVKRFDRFLIILRDGRLFSIDTGNRPGVLNVVDRTNLYASPEADTWYDEMLVVGNRLVITGYNDGENASEINLLSINKDGVFSLEATFFITSDDYYSIDNYATRLVNGHLVLFTPLELAFFEAGDPANFPQIRRWTREDGFTMWQPLFDVTDIYYPVQPTLDPEVHTISVCSLDLQAELNCKSTGIMGPPLQELYVTSDAAYLWMTSSLDEWSVSSLAYDDCPDDYLDDDYQAMPAALYRVPLFAGDPKSIHTFGAPQNHFSFSVQGKTFYALLRWLNGECEVWEDAPLKFATIPLGFLSGTPSILGASQFTDIPMPDGYDIENRFTNGFLVYGGSEGTWMAYGESDEEGEGYHPTDLVIVPVENPSESAIVPITHTAERIEVFGPNMIVSGYQGPTGLTFSVIDMDSESRVADSAYAENVLESDSRSHAFNAHVEQDGSGIFGITTSFKDQWAENYEDDISSNLHFFEVDEKLRLNAAGYLQGDSKSRDPAYRCEVSCVDWYGNARPIFMNNRIFALTANEVIEGVLQGGQIVESGRLTITSEPVHAR